MRFTKYNNPSRRRARRNMDNTDKMIQQTKNMVLDYNNGYTAQTKIMAEKLNNEEKKWLVDYGNEGYKEVSIKWLYECYRRKVNKEEYPTFECWKEDMLKCGLIIGEEV